MLRLSQLLKNMLLRRQKISMLAVFSCLGMSQHHGPWLRFRFRRYNASPTHAVVRLDAFLFLGSFPHTHPGLWLISLCSRVFWRIWPQIRWVTLYLLLFPWHHLCLCLVFRPCFTVKARPWDHKGIGWNFQQWDQRPRDGDADPHLGRFWTVFVLQLYIFCMDLTTSQLVMCWTCTLNRTCFSQFLSLKVELQIQFPSAPPAPEQQYRSAGYLSDPKPASASRIVFPHFPDSMRGGEPSMFNILHVLKGFD